MSRSTAWKQTWAFFLGSNGRRQYHPICRACSNGCKQSFRSKILVCSNYHSKASKKHPRFGSKNERILRCIGRIKPGWYVFTSENFCRSQEKKYWFLGTLSQEVSTYEIFGLLVPISAYNIAKHMQINVDYLHILL